MKVNSEYNKNISFNGLWNSKCVKKGLEFASDYGAVFAATTTLAFSTVVRPIVISATPKTKNENKKVASAKSIASGILEFLITLALSAPIVSAFKKIEANPTKFLNPKSINKLKGDANSISNSKTFSLATQIFKLGIGFAVILPKAILTSLGIPLVENTFLNKKEKVANNSLSFKGKKEGHLPKVLSRILNNESVQDFAYKYKDSNFPLHIFALKDILATGAFIHQANKNKQIKNEQKDFLTINSIISTALSLISSYTIDTLTDKHANKIIKKIKKQNCQDPKVSKYIEGFKIVKPIVILAVVYYTIIPFLSTLWAEKIKEHLSIKEF